MKAFLLSLCLFAALPAQQRRVGPQGSRTPRIGKMTDEGPVDETKRIAGLSIRFKPSSAQMAALDGLKRILRPAIRLGSSTGPSSVILPMRGVRLPWGPTLRCWAGRAAKRQRLNKKAFIISPVCASQNVTKAAYCTFSVATALATPATVTTTGCAPAGAFAGTVKLTCVTPTSHGLPANATSAFTPPT